MAEAGIAFKFVNDRPVGHTEINYHLVFNVKINCTRKARYVAGGNLTDLPDNVPTYASVVSCESVRILFLISALNKIKVLAEEISNALLNTQCANKACFKAGPELKSRKGLWLIIASALYGLNSAREFFREHLSKNLQAIGFKPTFSDPNVWIRKNFIPIPQ